MNGISFAECIHLRKLTFTGYDLKSTDLKVIDISYKYGYDSLTSFTKSNTMSIHGNLIGLFQKKLKMLLQKQVFHIITKILNFELEDLLQIIKR